MAALVDCLVCWLVCWLAGTPKTRETKTLITKMWILYDP